MKWGTLSLKFVHTITLADIANRSITNLTGGLAGVVYTDVNLNQVFDSESPRCWEV